MGILFDEVKYYRSENVDFSNPDNNGMGPGDEIPNDTLNSIFPEVSATQREDGLTMTAKIFVSNESQDRLMSQTLIYLKQGIMAPDEMTLYEATEDEYISFSNVDDLTATISAGTEVSIENIYPTDKDANDLVGRHVVVLGFETSVASAPTSTSVTFDDDITVDIPAGTLFETSDIFDFTESDEDFDAAKKYINAVTMSGISSGTDTVSVTDEDAGMFDVGDNILILDQYFRVIHRTTVNDIQQNQDDSTLYDITMSKEYSASYTIPAGQGYIANAFKDDISPGRKRSMWLRLTIEPGSAVDAEVINQFQLGVHFDDIEA
jgi:hypothetical protein